MLNLVPRPPFDEEIWVRDFVMLGLMLLGLGSYRFNSVMSNLFSIEFSAMYMCCCVQLSFLRVSRKCEPALAWLAGLSARECFIFSLHTKASVDKRESL